MPKIIAKKMGHEQAKQIPDSMWEDNQLFCESLDEVLITLMKLKTPADAIFYLNQYASAFNDKWKKKQAWLSLALTQPDNFDLLQESAAILNLDQKTVFSLFAILGNVDFLNKFIMQHEKDVVLAMIKSDEFYPYRKAAEHGKSAILKYLDKTAITLTFEMNAAYNYAAYKNAARNGFVETLEDIEKMVPALVNEMIRAQDYYAYRFAALHGHLGVLKHLEFKAPELVNEMEAADNFFAYRKSLEYDHPEVSNWLLAKSSRCFAFAEIQTKEFGERNVNPFITQQLAVLHREAMHGVTEISDAEQAKICFYIVRHLIRPNDRALDEEIRFLLNIPSVKALASCEVTAGQPNELLRLARTTGNHEAAAILLDIPEVRTLTKPKDESKVVSKQDIVTAGFFSHKPVKATTVTKAGATAPDDPGLC